MIKAPCKDCAERSIECHGTCRKYKAFKAETMAESRMIHNEKEKSNAVKTAQIAGFKRMKRGKSKPGRS